MKKIGLDTILLFPLLIFFVMSYRISPGDTPYILFGVIFLGLLSYISLDLFFNFKKKIIDTWKNILLWFLILATIGSAFYSSIVVRHQTAPEYNIHDIVIQQESAIRFLLHGKNPYSSDYFGTPLERWSYSDKEVNPALYHFVMGPFYLIFSIPFYLVSSRTIGFFDGRIPLVILFLGLLFLASKLVKDEERRRVFLVLLAFNPATLGYTLEGRSDIFMFAFLFASLFFLRKNKKLWSGILMGLAFAIKQSIWPILPFYAAYFYFKTKSIRKTLKNLLPFAITFIVMLIPFLIWDARAFLDSTVFYLSGSAANSYPIAGYGFGKVLSELGLISDLHSYYPFWIWQLIFCLPVLIFLLLWQKKDNNIFRLILSYGVFLFVFWYFSRYLNNSHLGYLSVIFLTAYFWPKEDE